MFARTELALEQCSEHLKEVKVEGSPVESYLVQYLLVILCSDIQKSLLDAVAERGTKLPDNGLRNFSNIGAERLLRSVKKHELAGFLEHFGEELKAAFNAAVTDQEVTQYNQAVDFRHGVAHPTAAASKQWTLADFQFALGHARSVVGKALEQLKSNFPVKARR